MGSGLTKHKDVNPSRQHNSNTHTFTNNKNKNKNNNKKKLSSSRKRSTENDFHGRSAGPHTNPVIYPIVNPPTSEGSTQYRCGGPNVVDGIITPSLSSANLTEAYWKRDHSDEKSKMTSSGATVLLYQIIIPRPAYDVWAFYNDTEEIHFLITFHFSPHPMQTREKLRPLGATTLVWEQDGTVIAKLCVGPAETSFAFAGHLVAYRVTIEGIPVDPIV
ncbi:putative calpain-like cysteine peptidase [Trypanosoma theileri]|uniref:Putative calpain-like cysteine peptidase n=1 Tax=Trypanosoma theileri TaxID=67003 RepID=A0A1X0NW74_9TRYP|nr:putative calpain-like cysteine peptidase [Trypanosoma theileri]ORC88954.1 putative calpain-like cysteine peptidase [Trypanosoma theileri]